ncbi:hypothetical protein, partial [Paractinoplanes durhamensis]|uniref:hypothetical protein n=1 Tax=Paractinoplanes durhamensis TaxID=113563 RepID=UPI0031D0B703
MGDQQQAAGPRTSVEPDGLDHDSGGRVESVGGGFPLGGDQLGEVVGADGDRAQIELDLARRDLQRPAAAGARLRLP